MRDTLATEAEGTGGSAYLSKADLRREFGFTDLHFARLGPADRSHPAAAAAPAELHRVYSRARVEQWVAENQALLEELQAKRVAREARSARDREAAESRRLDVHRQVAGAVQVWFARPLPVLTPPLAQIRRSLSSSASAAGDEATEQTIFTYILENLADYPALVRMLNRLEAGFELAAAVRILVCSRIIREYQLHLDPLEVAFPAGGRAMLSGAFTNGDPEAAAAAVIGIATQNSG